jgi:hypothetical protein
MIELMAIGLVDLELTNDIIYTKNNHPANVRVMLLKRDKFEWFPGREFKPLRDNFTPVDNRKFMQEPDPETEAAKAAAATEAAATTPLDDSTKKKNTEKLKAYDASQKKLDPMQPKSRDDPTKRAMSRIVAAITINRQTEKNSRYRGRSS